MLNTTLHRCATLLCLSVVVVTFALSAHAQATAQISIQGYVEDGGNPVNSPQTIELTIHTAVSDGTQLFSETHASVAVTDGVYALMLGSVGDLTTVDFNQSLWLQTKVGGTTLTPRTRLVGSPSAMTLVAPASISGPAPDSRTLTITNTASSGAYGHGLTAFSAGYGASAGLYGVSASTAGSGVVGYATATSGDASGVQGQTAAANGFGVLGSASAATGVNYGVSGSSNSTSGRGVFGHATSLTGITYGVFGRSESATGQGVYGIGMATSGVNTGVYGVSNSTSGAGVSGYAAAATGNTAGVNAESASTSGIALYADASAVSGSTVAIYGTVDSPNGYSGVFFGGQGVSISGGPVGTPDLTLRGTSNVDDNGNLYSDRNFSSSDLVFYSNDDIALHLDEDELDDGFGGTFTISNGANSVVFSVDELGAVIVNGSVTVNGSLVHSSDRNRKEGFAPVDVHGVLNGVAGLPLQSWRYREDPVTHIGPTAQDFSAAFQVGKDDVTIATVDADGVALAAIQALYQLVEKQRVVADRQEVEIRELKAQVARLLAGNRDRAGRAASRSTPSGAR